MTDLLGPSGDIDADALDSAAADVRDYCGWHIAPPREETLTFDGFSSIILPSLYVTEATISVDGTEADPEWYIVRRNGTVRLLRPYEWLNATTVSVTFTHGYDECPADVAKAVRALAKAFGGVSGSTVRVGQVSVTSNSAGAGEVGSYAAALGAYRLPRLA